MESARTSHYAPPINQLLTYGEAQFTSPDKWPNYLILGLRPEHALDLVCILKDTELNNASSKSLEVWAPIHALRALGQLHAQEAIEPLLSILEAETEDDWLQDEIPEVLGLIGPAALPALTARIADSTYDEDMHISAISSVDRIGQRWPEARPDCISLLTKHLELFAENGPEFNGFLILGLTNLHATEAAPLIKRAFMAGRVDSIVMGEWEDAAFELDLISAEELEQSRRKKLPETPLHPTTRIEALPKISPQERFKHEASHKKARRKMGRQSRKKNRKR